MEENRSFWIYILTNRPIGVLYAGMTNDLVQRIWQHRSGAVPGFSHRYNLTRLVYFERHASSAVAAQREHTIKRWRRAWKIQLIEGSNPDWRDLFDEIAS